MSIIIDVAQKFVLHNAYKLTNNAAVKFFHRYANKDVDKCIVCKPKAIAADEGNLKAPNDKDVKPEPFKENNVIAEPPIENNVKPVPSIENNVRPESPREPNAKLGTKPKQKGNKPVKGVTRKRCKARRVAYTERDIPRCNSGPIDPPQNSCMHIIRDSYFS